MQQSKVRASINKHLRSMFYEVGRQQQQQQLCNPRKPIPNPHSKSPPTSLSTFTRPRASLPSFFSLHQSASRRQKMTSPTPKCQNAQQDNGDPNPNAYFDIYGPEVRDYLLST